MSGGLDDPAVFAEVAAIFRAGMARRRAAEQAAALKPVRRRAARAKRDVATEAAGDAA